MSAIDQQNQQVQKQTNIGIEKFVIEQRHIEPNDADPYKDYLKKLLDRIERQLKSHIPTFDKENAEGIIPLEFKYHSGVLDPNYEIARQPDLIGQRYLPPPERFDNLQRAFHEFDGRLLLLGRPSAGKTVSLLLLARQSVYERMKDRSSLLPIIGDISKWNYREQTSIADWLDSSYGAPEKTKEIVDNGRALLLLDGLDYLVPEGLDMRDSQWLFVNKLPTNNQILLTCRFHTIQFLERAINLKGTVSIELSNQQISTFLSKFPSLKKGIRKNNELKSLLSTPSMLVLLADVEFPYRDPLRSKMEKLENSFDIHNQLIEIDIHQRHQRVIFTDDHHQESRLSLKVVNELCRRLASEAMIRSPWETRNPIEQNFIRQIAGERYQSFINEITQMGILIRTSENTYRFEHFFQDFFAFRYCLEQIPNVLEIDRGERKLHFIVTHLDSNNHAGFNSHEYQKALAKECASILKTIRLSSDFSDTNSDTFFAATLVLSRFGEEAIDVYSLLLNDENHNIRFHAIYALVENGQSFVVPLLLDALNDPRANLKQLAISGLGNVEDTRVIKPLISQLNDNDSETQLIAAEALTSFGKAASDLVASSVNSVVGSKLQQIEDLVESHESEEAIAQVMPMLKNLDEAEKLKVVLFLSIIANEDITRHLIDYTWEHGRLNQPLIRWTLLQLGKRFPLPIIDLLDSSSVEKRVVGIWLLGESPDENAISPLLSQFDDTNEHIQFSASIALAKFGESVLYRLLSEMITERQLIELTDSSIIPTIVSELKSACAAHDSTRSYQFATLLALIGGESIDKIPVVIDLLDTSDAEFQYYVSVTLIGMGASAFQPMLNAMRASSKRIQFEVERILEYQGIGWKEEDFDSVNL